MLKQKIKNNCKNKKRPKKGGKAKENQHFKELMVRIKR